ncbi:metallophosphoesterase family protein [Arcticibacter eurypsychrophilus]|uniref:metallophosphoesterase family protein n=1 Tax=Arcticibacter eurypsychrophilus TaxID=1434752 RepID=UPI00084D0B13|nr:metallophosphoesterase [Arcticibacter eurypsychrophilus]
MPHPDQLIRTTPIFKLNQPDDSYKFQPLPIPSGKYPYRLNLDTILKETNNQKMVFHMVGDTGTIRSHDFQKVVADKMISQFEDLKDENDQPQFLYHLGDIVYNFGESNLYAKQFFEPYSKYPAPIVAIAGNHDSDVNVENPHPYNSLEPFKQVFCDTKPHQIPFSGGDPRKSMTQPNIYWTLESPLATIIGLHSNVTKYGIITEAQKEWFIEELKHAAQFTDKALLVCLHHAPYSSDTNHGSSQPMIEFLKNAFQEANVMPDLVFSGHVHNYQRFIKKYENGKELTFVVAGAGGYDELHPIAQPDNMAYSDVSPLFQNIELQNYCFAHHGFLKITIVKENTGLIVQGDYYSIPHEDPDDISLPMSHFESFEVKIAR